MRVTLEHVRRRRLDSRAVRDVADLVLAVHLLGECAQPLLSPRQQDARPAALREIARQSGANPARCTRDYSYLHTRTIRRAVAVRPRASRTVARSTCLPLLAFVTFQSVNERPAESGFREPIFFVPSRKADDVSFFVELATTASRVVVRRQAFCFGTSHVTVGLLTTAL